MQPKTQQLSGLTFPYKFEELAGFRHGDFTAGLFNGVAEIYVCEDGEWLVTAIELECDNGKTGPDAASEMVALDRRGDARLWAALADSLQHGRSADFIQPEVEARITSQIAGYRG